MKETNDLCIGNTESKILSLSVEKLEHSRLTLVRIVQHESFGRKLHSIKTSKCLNRTSNILKLDPFLDTCGVLRVDDRLKHANI